jgi:hypothetical protein
MSRMVGGPRTKKIVEESSRRERVLETKEIGSHYQSGYAEDKASVQKDGSC